MSFPLNIIKKQKQKRNRKVIKTVNKRLIIDKDIAYLNLISKEYNITINIDIDDVDFCINNNLYLHKGYIMCKGKYLHRIIIERQNINIPKDMVVDHINRNKLDNRKCNLRVVTRSINYANSDKEIKGYYYRKDINKYVANICYHKRIIHLGNYDTKEDAHTAYIAAKNYLFTELYCDK